MERVSWRKQVRCIGYIDLVLSGIHVLIAGVFIIFALLITAKAVCANINGNHTQRFNQDPDVTVIPAWILAGLFIWSAAIQVLAGVRLLNSTNIWRQPADALRDAKFWWTVAITFMIIFGVIGVATGMGQSPMVLFGTVVWLGFRSLFVAYVWKFMGQLEAECETNGKNMMNGKGKV